MKILSNYKDYYDYLTGIYGVDEKVVLDRRKFDKFTPFVSSYSIGTVVQVFICDKIFTGYYTNNRYYWGKQLLELLSPEELEKFNNKKEKYKDSVSIQTELIQKRWGSHYSNISLIPKDSTVKYNTKHKCPILIPTNESKTDFYYYPILKDLGIGSLLPPMEIYLMLTAWLAPTENHQDSRTDKDKILGAGFDLKTSFRKM